MGNFDKASAIAEVLARAYFLRTLRMVKGA